VFDGHDLARGRVVAFEHVVEQAPNVRDFARRIGSCKLGECVGGFVDEGVDDEFGALVFDPADFEVVVPDFGVDGLQGRDQEWLGDVARKTWSLRVYVGD
jgi:hypothetical protein